MTSLHRIYKSQYLIQDDNIVTIEDLETTPTWENMDLVNLNNYPNFDDKTKENVEDDMHEIVQNKSIKTIKDQFEVEMMKNEIQNKIDEADAVLDKANNAADSIILKAKDEANKIKNEIINEGIAEVKKIQQQGYQDGFKRKEAEILELITYMNEVLKQTQNDLKQINRDFITEMEENVRFFALDIAKKILAKEIETDQLALSCMVLDVLENVQNDDKISVEISNKGKVLIERLKGEISTNEQFKTKNIVIEGVNSLPDSVNITHDTGLIDASISTQIQTLEDLFNKY